RAVGIPSRLGFGAVKNHIGTAKLEAVLGTNVLAFHGYTEFYLEDKWVKATPAFNQALCDKLNVEALDFDGEHDCLFQQFDKANGQFMEYIEDYGQFDDIPLDLFIETMKAYYPHLFDQAAKGEKFEIGELKVAL
ncbi:MAG: transglutaminase, partial [Flammeovirgaceae bacterium]